MGMRSRSRLMPIDTAPMPPLPDEDVNARNWNAIHATVIKIHSEIHIADSASTRANDNVRRACMFVEISDCRIQIAEFTNHLNLKSEIYTLQVQVVTLPGIKTVVIALSNDPPTLKLHEDGEPGPQLLARSKWTSGFSNSASPDYFHDDLVMISNGVEHLEMFGSEQSKASCAAFFHCGEITLRAVRHQTVWELLVHDIRREERIEFLRPSTIGKTSDVVFCDSEIVTL
jgi:hypothetical protein